MSVQATTEDVLIWLDSALPKIDKVSKESETVKKCLTEVGKFYEITDSIYLEFKIRPDITGFDDLMERMRFAVGRMEVFSRRVRNLVNTAPEGGKVVFEYALGEIECIREFYWKDCCKNILLTNEEVLGKKQLPFFMEEMDEKLQEMVRVIENKC